MIRTSVSRLTRRDLFQKTHLCCANIAFVTELNASGSALLYSTYLGGSGGDFGKGVAIDTSGNACVTGFTYSSNFPVTLGAFQTEFGGDICNGAICADAFVSKFDATGSALVYSTYSGGSSADGGTGIAVDASGNAYVTGDTGSTDFPTTAGGFQSTYGGGPGDAFVSKLNATKITNFSPMVGARGCCCRR
jgi:hypothetical protein